MHNRTLYKFLSFLFPCFLLLLCSLIMIIGCDNNGNGNGGNGPDETISWADEISTLLNAECNQCHSGSFPSNGFSIEAYSNLVNALSSSGNIIVVPDDPDNSELIWRLEGTNDMIKMPFQGSLPMDDIEMVKEWILTGALENE